MLKKFTFITVLMTLMSCAGEDFDIGRDSHSKAIFFDTKSYDVEGQSRNNYEDFDSLILRTADNSDTLVVTYRSQPHIITSSTAQGISRGAPVTLDGLDNFKVIAYMYDGISDREPIIFFDESVKKLNSSTWSTDRTYYWPSDARTLSFLAIYPNIDIESENPYGLQWANNILPTTESQATINYTTPDNIANTPDLMLAETDQMNNSSNGDKVGLQFKHLFSQVKFAVGTKMATGTINRITLKGIYTKGTYNTSNQSNSWSIDGETGDITITLDQPTDEKTSPGTQLGSIEQTFMALPQTLPEGAEIMVTFTTSDGIEKELSAPITGTWQMGHSIEYLINITPDNNLFFDSVTNEPQDCHYVTIPITINSEKVPENTQWTLESDQSWCTTRIGILHGPENQGFWIISPESMSGQLSNYNSYKEEYDKYNHTQIFQSSDKGSAITAYIFLEENISETERTATLSLKIDGVTTSTAIITQSAPIRSGNYLMENIEEETNLPWGFNWDRVVIYEGNRGSLIGSYLISNLYANSWKNQYGNYTGITISSGSGLIGIFNTQPTIEINYKTMSSSTDASSHDDGQLNTCQLYRNAGGNTLGFETQIRESNQFSVRSESGTLENNGNYAALTCIKKNAFPINIVREQQGSDIVFTAAINFSDERVKWYLPAEGQTDAFPSTGNYWSSTAGTTHADAFMMHNRISSGTTRRITEGKVRAVRNM